MAYLLKGALLATMDPPEIEWADLRVDGGSITARAEQIEPIAGDEVVPLWGRVVLPGMVCAHTHLYSALARGMPPPPRAPADFLEILELVWWRLDRALDEETLYWSALAGALEAARAGTTCLVDHHASPSCIRGSLDIIQRALEDAGLRGILCYETTDRNGAAAGAEGAAENRRYMDRTLRDQGLYRGMVGAHASFTLSDQSLAECAAIMKSGDTGLHIHAAEDPCDVENSMDRFGIGVVERLLRMGALNPKTILAHGTHLDARELQLVREADAWLAHNPRSNMNNSVGYAPVMSFGERLLLGTDGIGADMFEEARFAYFKGRDAHINAGADFWLRALANNQRFAGGLFGSDLRTLRPGSAADLVVLDYPAPTPLHSANLPWHFIFGMNSVHVESVMVGGRFIVRNRKSQLDETKVLEQCRLAAEKLWSRMAAIL